MNEVTIYLVAVVLLVGGVALTALRRQVRGDPPDLFALDAVYYLVGYIVAAGGTYALTRLV